MINFTNLISKVSKVLKVSQQNCESRMGTCQADAQHLPMTYLPVDSVSLPSRFRVLAKYVASLAVLLCLGIGQMWGAAYTWDFTTSSKPTINSKSADFTSTSGSKTITYIGGSSDGWNSSPQYLKMNGKSSVSSNLFNDRYFSFKAPSSSGTVTINYAGTASDALILTGSKRSIILTKITGTASTSVTSSVISGLTAGTTDLYIAFPENKSYINSITWTEAEDPTDTRLYYSVVKTTMETGASLSASSASQQTGGGTGWTADFSNYYKTSNSTGSVTITFGTPLSLNSNGSNRGRIRIYGWKESFALKVNGSSAGTMTPFAGTNKSYLITVLEYTIPDGTTTLSSIQMTGNSGNSGGGWFAVEVLTYPAPAGCPNYSFHTGGNDVQTNNTQSCFVQVGSSNEWQLTDYTIPADTKFFVGERGWWYNDNLGSNNSRSSAQTWADEMYLAKSFDSGDAAGSPKLGQATGATGTIRIYDNSSWNNLNAAFIPDGYVLRIGSTDKSFAVHNGNEYRSELVELSSSNARDLISVGVVDENDDYVATANTQTMQHLFLRVSSDWAGSSAKFSIYDIGASAFKNGFMVAVPGESNLYEGWVDGACTSVIFVRHNSTATSPSWDNDWNQTGDLTLQSGKNLFTITQGTWNGQTTGWSAYEKKGKFRMNDNFKDKNWYVRFNPYHVLTYDANGGSGAPAAQSVAADAVPCQWTLSTTQPTWADHVFLGWSTNSSAAEPDAASEVADLGTPYPATGDVTLYAVWTSCSGPTINSFVPTGKTDGTWEVGTTLGSITVTATAGNGGALSYLWYQYDGGNIGAAVAAAGTNNAATYNIPNNVACVERHYYCVVSEAGCSTTRTSDASGALTLTEPVDPCSEPAEVTNEIARFFVPCGTSAAYNVADQTSSTGDNTYTTTGFNGDRVTNATTGFIYGKLAGSDNYIQLKLNTGNFRAGDVINAYFSSNSTNNNLKLKSGSGNELGAASASGYDSEYVRTYTLTAADIEDDGSIKFFRKGSDIRVNRIIVTREPACFEITDAKKPGSGWSDRNSSAQEITSSMLVGTITGGTVLYTGSGTLGANGSYGLVFDNNNDEITITLSSGILPAGALIVIGARGTDGTSSHECGFTVSGNSMSPATTTSSTKGNSFTQTYTVAAADGIIGGSSFTIARVTDKSKTYLESIYIVGCEELSCDAFTVARGGQESGTYTVGSYDGSALTCTPTPAGTYTYQWKQYHIGQGVGDTINAVGTGATTASFTPNPASADTYFYMCRVLDPCGNKQVTTTSGTFVFTAATYTVTYNGNSAGGGTVPVDGTSYSSGATVTVLGNTGSLTRTIEGSPATFYGWNTNSTGYGGTHYEAGNTFSISANTTLYAEWGYPITYNTDDGTINDVSYPTHYIYTGSSACTTATLPTDVTKAGYTFDGWYTANGSGSKVTCIEGTYTGAFAGDYALKAKWEEVSDCEDLAVITATSTSALTATVGSVSYGSMTGGDGISIDGYSYSVKFNSSGHVDISPKAGETFAAGDSLIVVIYNHGSSEQAIGFKIGSNDYTATTDGRALHYFRQTLVAANISDGKVIINRSATNGSSGYIVAATIKRCGMLPPCTTPTLPSLSDQTVCPGSDIAAWNATPSNASAISAAGESVSYSWKKKGNDTELATTASFDLGSSATESQAGTYVVKVTVSKVGKASASASAEVDLAVTPATETPSVSASKAKVYQGDAVTLTATCGSTGITWEWYQCSDAVGTITGSKLSSTNSYTISSAPTAGTYYYKAVAKGDGTNSCGDAEYVYTLTVSAPSECENYVWWEEGAPTGEVQADCFTFGATPTGSNGQSASMTIDGTTYNSTKRSSDWNSTIQFTVPADATATFYICGKGTGARTITLTDAESHTSTFSMTTTFGTFHSDEIGAGTWTMTTNGNLHIGMVALHVCVSSTCTDAVPTATATNTTVCSGSELSITATGYEESPTSIQWQKLNSSTSTWDNISGATSATYTVASATSENAGSYRVVVTKGCARTSNTVTIAVPSAPVFGDVPASVSIMETLALSISTVEATDAVKYKWYKSADATWDAGDAEIGTEKNLIKAYDGETAGSTYYIFCRAQNACGITTSSAITVNVTAYVEEECAIRGNEGSTEFGFENNGMSSGTYDSKNVWYKNSNSNYLTYTAPEGKYLATAKVTIASSSSSNASYQYSTDNGANWSSGVTISGLTTSLVEKTINLPANVTDFRIGRNLDGAGESSGTFYLHKACFTYTEACTSTTVTPSTSSKTHTIGNSFTKPTFTLAPVTVSGETLTYSSSDEDIATVDDDGTVTFQGMAGTVKIIASYAGGTISATDYCASEGYYTITVSCSAGTPKVVVTAGSTNLSGCNASVTLSAKTQEDGDFVGGSYQWYRDGSEVSGATSSSFSPTQAGTYTVEFTKDGCTALSNNSIPVTSESTQPEVERLVPFQYYHVDKPYTDQMKMRHLFAVKNSGKLDGKSFKMYVSRNGSAATDVTNSNALVVWPNGDGHVDTVMVDLNKLSGKYSENDELVYTCKAIDCEGDVSEVYKNTITMRVIGATPTLALICSGSDKEGGTRKTSELTVGGDFLTGYNKADLCEQTGNTSFDASTEWGLYTRLKANYIVTPVNGYAVFNKLNYEPFDILLLTDYPKASKSDAAKDVLDDMAALCDYRPMLSFKTHMVAKSPSKWAAKGFTTEPVAVKQGDGRTHLNIVCYAHPMFDGIKDAGDHIFLDNSERSHIVYEMLTGAGHESDKGIQGFEIAAAENFVTIGLIHYNASIAENSPSTGLATWTGGTDKGGKPNDRMLVAAMERQANPEARMVVLAVNCGAQSKFTETGRTIVHKCLQYLLSDHTITPMADCSFTFDNGANAPHDAEWYKNEENCPGCTGTLGDGLWSTAANWSPDRLSPPGKNTEVKIAAPVTVDMDHAVARSARIVEGGHITIPAGKALEIVGTIRRLDGSEISPTENSDITIGSSAAGNGSLIFNNDKGDSKARVLMYSNAPADMANMSAATSIWQYIGTPHTDVMNARSNYYGSWLYQYGSSGWEVIPNGGPLEAFRGYCITNETAPIVYDMTGTLAATTSADIEVPANKFVVAANSWVAPIDITKITDDDMDGISDKTIYFFNTGSDSKGENGTGTAPGTYVAVPKEAASYLGNWQIPSMQGFYIGSTTAGTLHLDYDRHVRPTGGRSVVGNPMYAPQRFAEDNEPEVAKLYFLGSRYYDRLVVLEREDFTRGYDSGWDGEAWGGNSASPLSCVSGEGRWDAVSAIPEFEGTVVGFQAGEDNAYTIDFEYSEEYAPLYLYDTEAKTYSRVLTGNAYYFTTSDKDYHDRFFFTRNAPSVITGIEPTSDSSVEGRAKKLLIEEKLFILLNGVLYDATGKVVK